MDWKDCPLVQVDPKLMGGDLILRDHGLDVETLERGYELVHTADELAWHYDIPVSDVREIFAYVRTQQPTLAP